MDEELDMYESDEDDLNDDDDDGGKCFENMEIFTDSDDELLNGSDGEKKSKVVEQPLYVLPLYSLLPSDKQVIILCAPKCR